MNVKLSSLTFTGIVLRIIRKIGILTHLSRKLVILLVDHPNWRNKMNRYYNKLNFDEKSVFHTIFYNIFRNGEEVKEGSYWNFVFLDKNIKLPLRKNMIWLDWEHVISFLGHNIEVKETYQTLMTSKKPPGIFFDIGANYGLHSLLFLSQGIFTVSFEPNPLCEKEFNEYCKINNYKGKMETVAVGDREKIAELWFPEKETWLGTIDENTKKESYLLSKELKKLEVPIITIDNYVERNQIYPDLLKIDAEGYELKIISGAEQTIKRANPLIIFECNALNNKKEIWDQFLKLDYIISTLPLIKSKRAEILSFPDFVASKSINFIAIPGSHALLKNDEL